MSSTYISRAACNGKRPSVLVSETLQQRAHLIACLLKERTVARLIAAPSGYGKSALALDYAQTIFGYSHVFWLNAQSPCFIRDLDAQVLAQSCLECDAQAALVIIDDLPSLDRKRIELLSAEIESLMATHCEVVVTARPTSGIEGLFERDRILLTAKDLLLSDEEYESFSSEAVYQGLERAGRLKEHRVPALLWGSHGERGGELAFKKHVLSDEMPQVAFNVMASILVVQKGSFEAFRELTPFDAELLRSLRADYPHLGISSDLETFEAVTLDMDSLGVLLRSRMNNIVETACVSSNSELLEGWAAVLLEAKQAPRACELMDTLGGRLDKALWLASKQREVIRQGCFLSALPLTRNMSNLSPEVKARLWVMEALSHQILGDDKTALVQASRMAKDETLPKGMRACAHMIASKLGTNEDVQRALDFFAQADKLSEVSDISKVADSPVLLQKLKEGISPDDEWVYLAWLKLMGSKGMRVFAQAWQAIRDAQAPRDILCIGASWFFAEYAHQIEDASEELIFPELSTIQNYVHSCLEVPGALSDFYVVSAALAMEEAHQHGMSFSFGMMSAHILFGLRQFELMVLSQQGSLARLRREKKVQQEVWMNTHPYVFAQNSKADGSSFMPNIPTLTVHLFGTLKVSIGDMSMDDKGALKNHNARTLLAILAVNQGKEVTREAIAHSIWPDSSETVAKKNFYTTWSRLRKTLSLPDGTCPYLIRHRYGCSLNQRCLSSDIERFNEICRILLFETDRYDDWSNLFFEIDRDFSSELLPGEMRNELIIDARKEHRDRLVDALVSASVGILDAGDPKWGTCFAREALRHDETREDAYVALMRSQIAFSQRTSAIMTYLKCQRILNERLGIDPSPETSILYQDLLAGDMTSRDKRNDSMAKG